MCYILTCERRREECGVSVYLTVKSVPSIQGGHGHNSYHACLGEAGKGELSEVMRYRMVTCDRSMSLVLPLKVWHEKSYRHPGIYFLAGKEGRKS